MKLLGMLDSPYVRRVAISLDLYGVKFEHEPLSVFSSYDAFSKVNPVVKAPTVILNDGSVLMDSTLILNYFEALSSTATMLMPCEPQALAASLRGQGLALAACEKAVQIVYEHNLRPAEKLHEPWLHRVSKQLLAACGELDCHISRIETERLDQAAITSAVAWSFIQMMLPEVVKAGDFPSVSAHAARLEQIDVFKRYPMV